MAKKPTKLVESGVGSFCMGIVKALDDAKPGIGSAIQMIINNALMEKGIPVVQKDYKNNKEEK